MLYLFYGSDVVGTRSAAHEFLHSYQERGIGALSITTENYSGGVLTDRAGATSLFGGEEATLLDTLSLKKEIFEELLQNLELLFESKNTFVVIEGSLLQAAKKKFEKHAKNIKEFKADKASTFNTFSLTDAYTNRDKKSLWMLLISAWRKGISNEEIIGVLFWQVKMLRLAERTQSPEEAGMKPFVYNKSKRALTKFSEGEIDDHSRTLLTLYHDGHLGKCDISVGLERFVLTL